MNDWDWGWAPWPKDEKKPLTKCCECGTNITMGYNAPEEFHSSWCILGRKPDDKRQESPGGDKSGSGN